MGVTLIMTMVMAVGMAVVVAMLVAVVVRVRMAHVGRVRVENRTARFGRPRQMILQP